jgi:hypothetical protein
MTPDEVIVEHDRQGRREGWPPMEPRLLTMFRWANEQVHPAEAKHNMLARAIYQFR